MRKLLTLALMIVGSSALAQPYQAPAGWDVITESKTHVILSANTKGNLVSIDKATGAQSYLWTSEASKKNEGTDAGWKWYLRDAGVNGWAYLHIQGDDSCDSVVVALFDKDGNFLEKTIVYLDFGVGKTLIINANAIQNAHTAKIKCDY